MSLLTSDAQTRLLFKQFMGVASTALEAPFSSENYNFVPNIFSKDVMIEEIPDIPPFSINTLDASGDWVDSSSNYNTNTIDESTYSPTGQTFTEMFPDSKLKFYKRLSLVPVDAASQGRVWGSFSDYSGAVIPNKNSLLEHAIPFKYDDINSSYLPIVRRNTVPPLATNFQQIFINSYPVYWLFDSGSGYLLFYASQGDLEAVNIKDIKDSNQVQIPEWAPTISCFIYNGKTGITNLDVSGQQQVADISETLLDVQNIKRMVLPDGSATVLDLCGNDAIRSQYNYIRKNLFVGYPTQPIIDNSNVDNTQDPSYNSVKYELDVSGNTRLNGNVDISGNLDISGNIDISGNLDIYGLTTLTDVSATNLSLSGTLDVTGKTTLTDVSATNLSLSGTLDVTGKTTLTDVSATNLSAIDISAITIRTDTIIANTQIINNSTFGRIDASSVYIADSNVMQILGPETFTITNPLTYYIIALLPLPSANVNTSCTGYFTFKCEDAIFQTLNFMAGLYIDFTANAIVTLKPFIKVLSNTGVDLVTRGVINIIIAYNPALAAIGGGPGIYLLLGMGGPAPVNKATVRLYENNRSETPQSPTTTDWILNPTQQNFYEDPAWPINWTIYSDLSLNNLANHYPVGVLHNDNSAFSTLDEHFMGQTYFGNDVKMSKIIGDISGVATNYLDISGDVALAGSMKMSGELEVYGSHANVLGNLEVSGHTQVVDLSATNISTSELIDTIGNDVLVDYMDYTGLSSDAADISLNGQWQTIARIPAISGQSSIVQDRNSKATFVVSDFSTITGGIRAREQITFSILRSYDNSQITVLNHLRPSGTSITISSIRVEHGDENLGGSSPAAANIQLLRKTTAVFGTGTTRLQVRMYRNLKTEATQNDMYTIPFELTTTPIALINTITYNTVSIDNVVAYFPSNDPTFPTIPSITLGGDLDVNNNDIINCNSVSSSGTLKLEGPTKVEFKSGNSTMLEYNYPSLDFNGQNIVDVTGINSASTLDISSVSNFTITSGSAFDISASTLSLYANTHIDISANSLNMNVRNGDANITLDISTNELWFTTIQGSGYASQREDDAGLPGAGGWPSSGTSPGYNTIVKHGRWLDMGGQAVVNMFTLPTISPWNNLDPEADGRGKIGMNFRSTDRYYLRRFAQGSLSMGTNKILLPELDFTTKTPTEADALFASVGDVGFVGDPSGGLVQYNHSQLNMVNSGITRYNFSAPGYISSIGGNLSGFSQGGSTAGWTLNPASTGQLNNPSIPPSLTVVNSVELFFNAGMADTFQPNGWSEWRNSTTIRPGDVSLHDLTNIYKLFYEMPQQSSKGHIVGCSFYGPVGVGTPSACFEFGNLMVNSAGWIEFRICQSGSGWTPNTGCDFFKITKDDEASMTQGRLSFKNSFRDSTYVDLGDEIRIDIIIHVKQTSILGTHGHITLMNDTGHIDFMINHLLKL